jgi:hypothetical protein
VEIRGVGLGGERERDTMDWWRLERSEEDGDD